MVVNCEILFNFESDLHYQAFLHCPLNTKQYCCWFISTASTELPLGTPRIEPGAAGCEARTLSIVLRSPPKQVDITLVAAESIALCSRLQQRWFFLWIFLGTLGIKSGAAESESKYANHCAMLPFCFKTLSWELIHWTPGRNSKRKLSHYNFEKKSFFALKDVSLIIGPRRSRHQ